MGFSLFVVEGGDSDLPFFSLKKKKTLDLRESGLVYFTEGFWKLQQLSHLFLSGDCGLPPTIRRR